MSKSKSKGRSEVEHLRGEVKQLRKQLNYFKRQARMPDVILETKEDYKPLPSCPKCGKGELLISDFKFVELRTCDICEYQAKIRKT